MVKMTSWFKKHFTCIRREPSSLVGGGHLDNTTAESSEQQLVATIKSVKNDLKAAQPPTPPPTSLNPSTMIKNSNEYRDYTRNCESNYIAAENYCSKLKKNNARNVTNNNNNCSIRSTKVATKAASSGRVEVKQTNGSPPAPREINNNLGLEQLMRRLRACNECTSQGKICKS